MLLLEQVPNIKYTVRCMFDEKEILESKTYFIFLHYHFIPLFY